MGGSLFGRYFVTQYFVSVWFCNHLVGEERAGCFAKTVFLMSYVTVSVMWLFLAVPWVGM